ncbi:MAG: Zn-ribbon domain-containing OB-fold protein [Alphaproteobacteria bacterium]|nr:Zn-ribbon domain-containing OB-fold protein [Alphaproteobacteria bacterium]MCB9931680.1 Zn-ribbon domain-containing OB-fold protein [Alphaproteobacteria bacterium]
MTEAFAKPLPQPSIDSQPFWEGLKDRRILLQTCRNCGKKRHYPRPVCDACYSMESDWTEASGRGTLYSWTETHHPFHIGFKAEVPYILVTVDLEEGVRMQSQLVGAKLDDLKLGLPVEAVFADAADGFVLPYFRLVG